MAKPETLPVPEQPLRTDYPTIKLAAHQPEYDGARYLLVRRSGVAVGRWDWFSNAGWLFVAACAGLTTEQLRDVRDFGLQLNRMGKPKKG